jgi:hypothetical protein
VLVSETAPTRNAAVCHREARVDFNLYQNVVKIELTEANFRLVLFCNSQIWQIACLTITPIFCNE